MYGAISKKRIKQAAFLATIMIIFVSLVRTQLAWGEEAANAPDSSDIQLMSVDASIFASGTGTEADPYMVDTAAQLEAFRDSVNSGESYAGKFVKLASDVDISGSQWTPIGASVRSGSGLATGSTPFSGTFDGGGHTVSGLAITQTGTQSKGDDHAIGLFGAIMGGTVKDLVIKDANIRCTSSELAGICAGFLSQGGTISGVSTSGSLLAECGCGGIVGKMTLSGTISGCQNSASVRSTGGSGNCGGIAGAAYYTQEGAEMHITDCINTGAITGTNDVGGICGLCCGFISGCKNEGAVTGTSYSVGGIAGEVKCLGGISKCTNSADITNTGTGSPYGTGGIVGWVRYDGAAPAYAASAPITVTDNVNTGSVTTASTIGVGGIAGVLYSAGVISGNENHAKELSGKQFIAGIVGNLQDQGASTLPSTVPEGATVENNVSTTATADMSGALTDQFAYNNDPSIFTVVGNGTQWVATSSATGDTRYATLPFAAEHATDGSTITLIADSNATGMLEAPEGENITLDLNGHNIQFAPDGGITAAGDTVTIQGEGDLFALDDDDKIDPDPELFTLKTGSSGKEGHVLLKGGTYPTDISEYVAPGYEMSTLSAPDAVGNLYEVGAVPTPDKPDQPITPVTPGTADNTNGASGNDDASDGSAKPTEDAVRAETQVGSDPSAEPQLGDDSQTLVALLLLGAAVAAMTAAAAALRLRSR
ncbi:MAG: hypothetical protein HFJ65_05125 [Eggerthellaceae bacterium]|nr:hypothetical protein [Eggerthellaceae bacterium]